MAAVPDPFRPAARQRVREEPNEDELGKALPDTVIRQLDARLDLLGPAGRAGSIPAAGLQPMHQTIYQILRDTGRRPGEVVSLRTGCVEVTGGQHNLIYDNHKAGRMRRRLPITAGTAEIIMAWQQHRARLRVPPALDQWLFPSPLLRARQSRGHLTPACGGPGVQGLGRPRSAPSTPSCPGRTDARSRSIPPLITPYALRHSYAQRHADAGVPVDVLKELMDHVSVTTTMGYYRVSLKRKQQAIRSVGPLATDAAGNPAPFTSPTAYERASVAVPFGNCTEPSNVKAGGGACPIRFQCAGCGFYRPDPSYLPALEQHIASLRADRETALAIGAAGLRAGQPHRRDRRVHRGRRHDAAHAVPAGPRPARRGRGSQPDPAPGPRRPHPAADRHHLPRHGHGMTATTRTQAMLAARAKDSQDKRQRALAADAGPRSRRDTGHRDRGRHRRRGVHLAGLRRRRPRARRSRPAAARPSAGTFPAPRPRQLAASR